MSIRLLLTRITLVTLVLVTLAFWLGVIGCTIGKLRASFGVDDVGVSTNVVQWPLLPAPR